MLSERTPFLYNSIQQNFNLINNSERQQLCCPM